MIERVELADDQLDGITLRDLEAVFSDAETATSQAFGGQTCGLKNVDGEDECPICHFWIQMKKLVTERR